MALFNWSNRSRRTAVTPWPRKLHFCWHVFVGASFYPNDSEITKPWPRQHRLTCTRRFLLPERIIQVWPNSFIKSYNFYVTGVHFALISLARHNPYCRRALSTSHRICLSPKAKDCACSREVGAFYISIDQWAKQFTCCSKIRKTPGNTTASLRFPLTWHTDGYRSYRCQGRTVLPHYIFCLAFFTQLETRKPKHCMDRTRLEDYRRENRDLNCLNGL